MSKLQQVHQPAVAGFTETPLVRRWLMPALIVLQCLLVAAIAWQSHRFGFDSATTDRPVTLVLGLLLLQFLLYLASLFAALRLPPTKSLFAVILGVSVLLRGLLLPSTPIQEVDIYRYMWDGVVATQGISPFQHTPLEFQQAEPRHSPDAHLIGTPVASLKRLVDEDAGIRETLRRVHYPELPTVYPPTSQAVFAAASWATPTGVSIESRLALMKSVILLFDIGAILLLGRILFLRGMHSAWTIAYAWSPLVLKEFANSGHLDAITICITLAALLWLHPPAGRQLSVGQTLVSAGLAGLAVGGKLYPIVLFPLIAVFLLRAAGSRKALAWGTVATLATLIALAPMFWESVRAVYAQSLAPANLVDNSRPAALLPPPPNPKQLNGLNSFLTQWEMNDLLFMIVEENLRPDNSIPGQRPLWFVFVPNETRELVTTRVAGHYGLDEERVPFLLTRLLTLAIFGLVGLWLCHAVWNDPSRLLEACFLCIAWFWLLAPTQNPWYWTWALCLVPFARNPIWLATSGLTLVYYLRFWLLYHFTDTPILGTLYQGVYFFDFILTWFEFGPLLLLLTIQSWFRWRKSLRGKSKPEHLIPFARIPEPEKTKTR